MKRCTVLAYANTQGLHQQAKPHILNQGPVVQNIVSLTSLLMTNSLTVFAKVCSNALTFFATRVAFAMQFKSFPHCFQQKISKYAIFLE